MTTLTLKDFTPGNISLEVGLTVDANVVRAFIGQVNGINSNVVVSSGDINADGEWEHSDLLPLTELISCIQDSDIFTVSRSWFFETGCISLVDSDCNCEFSLMTPAFFDFDNKSNSWIMFTGEKPEVDDDQPLNLEIF